MGHDLLRTSPKGGPFLGRCVKCGVDGLTLADRHKDCVNPAGLDQGETFELVLRLVGRRHG